MTVQAIEEATFAYLRALSEIDVPRELAPCVNGMKWAIRGTLGKELERLGVPLRFPEAACKKGGQQ